MYVWVCVLSGVPGHRLQRAGLSGVYSAESTGGRRYGGHQGNRGCVINHISFSITQACVLHRRRWRRSLNTSSSRCRSKHPLNMTPARLLTLTSSSRWADPVPVQTSTEHDTSTPPNIEQPLSGSGAGPNVHWTWHQHAFSCSFILTSLSGNVSSTLKRSSATFSKPLF